jgi:small-conductance mechanosensitive channel
MAHQVRERAVKRAKWARAQTALLIPLIAGVIVAYSYRDRLFGADVPVRFAAVVAFVILGWAFAMSLGRAVWPVLERRVDPGTAGTIGFLIRLVTIAFTLLVALRFAGLRPATLAVGGAFTAVIIGLAAQQTIGNLIAGMVLLSARPFRVGDQVRLQAGAVGGVLEGVVSSLGLLYTTLTGGGNRMMVPNNIVLTSAIVPLREPSSVEVRARLASDVRPSDVHKHLEEVVSVPTRAAPNVDLEEFDGDEMVVLITATPIDPNDGPALADEVVGALDEVSRDDRDAA